jgi:hypothetical protein
MVSQQCCWGNQTILVILRGKTCSCHRALVNLKQPLCAQPLTVLEKFYPQPLQLILVRGGVESYSDVWSVTLVAGLGINSEEILKNGNTQKLYIKLIDILSTTRSRHLSHPGKYQAWCAKTAEAMRIANPVLSHSLAKCGKSIQVLIAIAVTISRSPAEAMNKRQ